MLMRFGDFRADDRQNRFLAHTHGVVTINDRTTVEPLNNGHIGGRTLIPFREIIPILEIAS